MKNMIRVGMAGAAFGLAFTAMTATADESLSTRAPVAENTTEGVSSPNVWVCSLPQAAYWGQNGGIRAFSIATTSANKGNINLQWVQNGQQHPVISQDMYRFKDGIMEHVGMSWLKHGFCSLQQVGCGPCQVQGGCLSFLKPGCSDPYSSALNGQTNLLGPRSEVNATTGVFAWPHAQGSTGVSSTIRSRLQVEDQYVNGAMNPNARWYFQGQYVHPQDAQSDLDNDNATIREIDFSNYNFPGGQATITGLFVGGSIAEQTAIEQWQVLDPSVTVDYVDFGGTTDGGGRIIVASRVNQVNATTWHYEYAVFNMNSDRSVGTFSVEKGSGALANNIGFHAPEYHSGEPYSNAPWPGSEGGSSVTWATESFASNANANAIRWATMYNFRFDSNAAPVSGVATLGLFKPGTPTTLTADVMVPGVGGCLGDINGDGVVDGADLASMLSQWGGPGTGDLNGDGTVDGQDLANLLGSWGDC